MNDINLAVAISVLPSNYNFEVTQSPPQTVRHLSVPGLAHSILVHWHSKWMKGVVILQPGCYATLTRL